MNSEIKLQIKSNKSELIVKVAINFYFDYYKFINVGVKSAIPVGAKVTESQSDNNSLFVDSSVNFDSLAPSSINTTSVESREGKKDSSSVSTSLEAKIPAGIAGVK